MRISIDIDNCIANFDDTLLQEYLKHDMENVILDTDTYNECDDQFALT